MPSEGYPDPISRPTAFLGQTLPVFFQRILYPIDALCYSSVVACPLIFTPHKTVSF